MQEVIAKANLWVFELRVCLVYRQCLVDQNEELIFIESESV